MRSPISSFFLQAKKEKKGKKDKEEKEKTQEQKDADEKKAVMKAAKKAGLNLSFVDPRYSLALKASIV